MLSGHGVMLIHGGAYIYVTLTYYLHLPESKGKGWVYSLVSSGNLSPDFTITPLVIGNGPTHTY